MSDFLQKTGHAVNSIPPVFKADKTGYRENHDKTLLTAASVAALLSASVAPVFAVNGGGGGYGENNSGYGGGGYGGGGGAGDGDTPGGGGCGGGGSC